jgi:nucleotide-binding universal stress UspA family protein
MTNTTPTSLFANTLVAIDDSDASLEAVRTVIPSVKAAGGKMVVVFVRQRPIMFDSMGVESSEAYEIVEESLTAREADAERDATALLSGQGIPSTFVVRDGDPAHEIIAAATDHGASVVVLGSPVHSVVGSLFTAPVSEHLMHHCAASLLIIRPHE